MAALGGRQNPVGYEPDRRTLPNFEQRLYMPHSIAAIVSELAGEGIAPSETLKGTGLLGTQLDNHATRVSYQQIDIVVRNALRLSSQFDLALRAGRRMRVTAYGMYGYALLSSPTLKAARDFAAKYILVVGPFCDGKVNAYDELVEVTIEPLYWLDPMDDLHRFAVEFALAAHLTATRDRIGAQFTFSRIFLDYAPPLCVDAYDALFECPIMFGQDRCGYEYLRIDGPAQLGDPRSHSMAREMCEQLLAEVGRAGGVAADIRRILIEQPGRYPSIEAVAEKLSMYPRALRRKLEAEGASYRELLAEVRMRLAIEYLCKTRMTNEEIANRLGYSDAANFRHAFIRWTGKSPTDFRNATRE